MLIACICGGVLEVGILACLVSGVTCFGTSLLNRSRHVAHLDRIADEQKSNSEGPVVEDDSTAIE
ncbi:MAG: hypothetical protein P8N76_12825 [Pirellulaceae bacterium]|nr:hypothetical protein [Pirellulaceae bacterium]